MGRSATHRGKIGAGRARIIWKAGMKSRQDLHLSPAARRPSAKAYGSSTAITNATAICRSIFSAAGSCFWRNCVPRTSTCESHSRNHPAQAPEAWSAGDGQRAAHQDRHRVRLPHEGRVRECSPATMFRRLNWRTRPVPPSKRHCRGSSARFATPARKPCLSKQGVRLWTPPMEQKLRDHNAGEKCGLADPI